MLLSSAPLLVVIAWMSASGILLPCFRRTSGRGLPGIVVAEFPCLSILLLSTSNATPVPSPSQGAVSLLAVSLRPRPPVAALLLVPVPRVAVVRAYPQSGSSASRSPSWRGSRGPALVARPSSDANPLVAEEWGQGVLVSGRAVFSRFHPCCAVGSAGTGERLPALPQYTPISYRQGHHQPRHVPLLRLHPRARGPRRRGEQFAVACWIDAPDGMAFLTSSWAWPGPEGAAPQ